MTAILTCDRCNEKVNMKAYLPETAITIFPVTYWMLDKLQAWYSSPSIQWRTTGNNIPYVCDMWTGI
jgi:hypothetical protein